MTLLCSIVGLFVGIALGTFLPVTLPLVSGKYLSVLLLAALDAVLGGARAATEGKLDAADLLLGFVTNAVFAALLVFAGARLGIDLYYVALLAFGLRIFKNLARIRHHVLLKRRVTGKIF